MIRVFLFRNAEFIAAVAAFVLVGQIAARIAPGYQGLLALAAAYVAFKLAQKRWP